MRSSHSHGSGTETTLHEILDALVPPDSASAPTPEASGESPLVSPCVLCRLTETSVARSLRAWFAEFINDPPSRERLRRSRGFCREHSRVVSEVGDALGAAILYADLADQIQSRWQAKNIGTRRAALLARGDRPAPCPACIEAKAAEQRYAGALADGLAQPKIWARWEEQQGILCVAHTEMTLAQADPQTAERLRNQQVAQIAHLQAELEEIIRKHDYRFRGEAWGKERTAWRRALHLLFRPPSE